MDALEARLNAAQERLHVVMQDMQRADRREEYKAAQDELLAAKRTLAEARGQEYAVPLEGLPPSDVGAPLPHVLADGRHVLLTYYVAESDPAWDGTDITIVNPAENRDALLAVVTFDGYVAVRMGVPNDEALDGHPLYTRGLEAYAMHLVLTSSHR